jgi:hypothetical protein
MKEEMTNDEARMTNVRRDSFFRHSGFVIRP